MTTMIGLEHGGVLYLGADGRANSNGFIFSDSEDKLIDFGVAVVGCCGAWRAGTVLRREAMRGNHPAFADPWEWVDWYRQLLIDDGWEPDKEKSEAPRVNSGGVLLWTEGPRRGVYDFCSAMSLTRVDPGWPATRGSGAQEAAGALLALIESQEPEAAILKALAIASKLDSATGGTIHVIQR